ncbi:uncharacterized protein METZ01_LOCUS335929, partial [marine metagenome]
MFFTHCEKKVVNQKEPLSAQISKKKSGSENWEIIVNETELGDTVIYFDSYKLELNTTSNGASLSHSTLDQAYNEFMWLEFEKLTNRQLLNKMKEDGYKKANPLLMLNDVLTSHGIQISKFNSSMLNQDFAEVKRIMELINTSNNDP